MNQLELTRTNTATRNQRSNPADFLMAKAYRGVPYVDAHHSAPAQTAEDRPMSYRGVAHRHLQHHGGTLRTEQRHFIYRGQSYER